MDVINNGNWTEWSAIWSEIIRVISKSNERAKKDVILCVANLLIQYNHMFLTNCEIISSKISHQKEKQRTTAIDSNLSPNTF